MTEQYYKMTLSDAIAHYQADDLTAKGLVHLYIRIRCKPGWKIKLDPKEVCPLLGIKKTAFYQAIKRLKTEGSIDWDAPQGILVSVHERGNQSATAESQFATAESQSAITESQFAIAEFKSSKASPDKVSDNSPYSYQIFINSLSEGEREKFLEFGLKKAAELPKPPTLPEKWVENHHLELYQQFKKTPLGKNLAPTKDWANHPQRDSWIAQMREKGEWAFILQAPKEDQPERRAFHDWADANNLIWPELGNRESQVC